MCRFGASASAVSATAPIRAGISVTTGRDRLPWPAKTISGPQARGPAAGHREAARLITALVAAGRLRPYYSFRGPLGHLATLTRNQVRFAGAKDTVPMLAEPTGTQRQAFNLIGVPIPLTLR